MIKSASKQKRTLLGIAVLGVGAATVFALARPKPGTTLAVPGTPCSSCALGVQTPSDPTMIEMLKIVAGTSRKLGIDAASGDYGVGGSWSAEYGSFDATGVYTAPSFLPPSAVDTLVYTDPQGKRAEVAVRIVPNPNIPGSEEQPYVTNANLDANGNTIHPYPYETPTPTPTASSLSTSTVIGGEEPGTRTYTLDQARFPSGAVVTLPPGTTPAAPVPTLACVAEVDVQIGSVQGFRVPATDGEGLGTSAFFVLADQTKPLAQKCKAGPFNPKPTGSCASGQKVVKGPLEIKQNPTAYQDGGSISVNVSGTAKAEIKTIFHVDLILGVNVITKLMTQIIDWKRFQYNDIYVCKNGKWEYSYSELCQSMATGVRTVPAWYVYFLGYPKDGAPGLWTPMACQKVR